jgi:hypothetical protein
MTFKFQNKYLQGFLGWFGVLGDMTPKEARMRSRFVQLLVPRIQEIAKSHNEILLKYCKKDEQGEPIKTTVNGVENYDIADADMAAFQKDDQELLDEDFVLEITPENAEMFATVQHLVLNTNFTFGPKEDDELAVKQEKINQMADYDTWCKAFESAQ